MNIFVTNDDGVNAPGLLTLVQEMRQIGNVFVLAPDHNWSASGHVKTMHRPMRINEIKLEDGTMALTSDGAPSDCVALALLGIFPEKIDLVVSGINPRANLGHDVTYSGTVTAAMEAAIWGVPGIAFSLDSPENHLGDLDYSVAGGFARHIVKTVINHHMPSITVLKH
jgi:5'-nucleotidase